MNKKTLFLILAFTFLVSSCGGRLPSTTRSQHLIQHYFKKYAKKYPETIYGQNKLKKVEIENREEIRKHFVSVEAYIVLEDGNLRKIYATLEKKSLGWKFFSWEDATGL